jgi:hypothetical protein
MGKLTKGLGFLMVMLIGAATGCDERELADDAGSDASDAGDSGDTGDTGDTGDAAADLIADSTGDAAPDMGGDASSPDTGGDASAGDTDGGPLVEATRFAIEVSNDIPESIWVQLNDASGQIAWVTVTDADGERVYLTELCDIDECENPQGVCGISLPMVRDITGGDYDGSIEHFWHGDMSVFEGEPIECEVRMTAPAGAYHAEFCYSLAVELEDEGSGDPTVGVPGTISSPICGTVDFDWPTDEVVFGIYGG